VRYGALTGQVGRTARPAFASGEKREQSSWDSGVGLAAEKHGAGAASWQDAGARELKCLCGVGAWQATGNGYRARTRRVARFARQPAPCPVLRGCHHEF
jgi:hypothetical protein